MTNESSMQKFKEIVMPFYTKCLTVNKDTNVSELMGKLLADDFKSISSTEIKSKAQLTGQVQFFWKLIPDLKWEIQEMLQDGNRVIVRSIASGSPKGDFMGLPTDGSKSFKIMTIDIHTVENGQVVQVYHLEDWPAAMNQLKH
ncbi:MAG: ester cyclase [Methanomicrobiales archaeon]